MEYNNLDLSSLRAMRVLGRGAMGTVFLVTHQNSPPFALKVVQKTSPDPSKPADAIRRARWELSVLSRLSNGGGNGNPPFLPTLLGSLETPSLLAYALPFCPGGDLNALRYSLSDRIFSLSAIRFYVSEILVALSHLHSLGIVYRDLKPENVLIQSDGHVVLTDFDLSRHLQPVKPPLPVTRDPRHPHPPPPHPRPTHRRNLTRIVISTAADSLRLLTRAKSARVSPVSRRRRSGSISSAGGERSNSFVGTEEYVAPEVVRGDGHDFAVDFWALGVLTYEMAFGRTPFKGKNRKETFRNVLMKSVEFVGRQRSDLTDLIGRLLAKDPAKRLGHVGGAEEVKEHVFFRGVKWDMLTTVSRPPYFAAAEDLEEAGRVPLRGGDRSGEGGFDIREYFENIRSADSTPLETSLSEF